MYIVTIENNSVETEIHGTDEKLKSGKVVKGINAIDSFSFSMLPSNAGFDLVHDFTTLLKVYNTNRDRYEFYGRVLYSDTTMSESGLITKDVTCESYFGFLCDSQQTIKGTQNWTVRGLFQHLIDAHNAQVENYKRFTIGEVTVTDPNDNLYLGIQYQNTWEAIKEKLLDKLGGEIRFRVVDGVNYIDYLTEIGKTSETEIALSHNMKSIKQERDPSAYITRLIPLGMKMGENDERLEITEVNGGKNYIDDTYGIAQYGIHVGYHEWDDVTEASNLLAKGRAWLEENNKLQVKYSITALDLSLLGLDIDDFDVCNYHPIKNELLGIDDTARIIKKSIDVCEEVKSTIEVGDNFKSLSDIQISQAQETAKVYSKISKTSEEIKLEVVNEVEGMKSTLSQTANSLTSRIESVEGSSSEIAQTLSSLSSRIESAEGDISSFEQTANSLSSTVSNLDGKYTSLKQTVDGFDIEGDINNILDDGVAQMNFVYGGTKVGTVAQYGSGTMIVQGAGELLVSANDGMLQLNGTDGVEINSDGDIDLTADDDIYIDASYGQIYMYGGDTTVKVTDDGMSVDNDLWVDGTKIASSDANVKNSMIYDLDAFTDLYRTLKPCRFKYNKGKSGRFHTGFIAQEIEQAIADAGFADTDLAMVVQENHGTEEAGKYGVRYEELIALNTAMVQKLMDRIDALEAEIKQLKGE